jgi:hypothetical protein
MKSPDTSEVPAANLNGGPRTVNPKNQRYSRLAFADLEAVYDQLAAAIDAVGEQQTPKMLTKLALLLSAQLDDRSAVEAAISEACEDL